MDLSVAMKYLSYGLITLLALVVYFGIGTGLAILGRKYRYSMWWLFEEIWTEPGFVVGLWPLGVMFTLLAVAAVIVLSPIIILALISMHIGEKISRKY